MLNNKRLAEGYTVVESTGLIDAHLLRILSVFPASAAVTFALVWGMEWLVRLDPNLQPPVATVYVVPNAVLVERDPPPVERNKPEPPKPVELPPELPAFDPLVQSDVHNVIQKPVVDRSLREPVIGGYSGNTPIPTVMVQPNYPTRAANKGIEGFVDVQFDVTPMGSTDNIVVLGSEPERIFDSAAVKAVKRWRYKPVTIEGKTVRYEQMVQRLVFEMAKGA